jgi:transcriptional regulator with XRE-family HTH domain
MNIRELGYEIRRARLERGFTQADLARVAGISRQTLNQLESGLVRDLGIRKVVTLLEHLGLALAIESREPHRPDYVAMACTTANVSLKSALTEQELIHALVTGRVPAHRAPHLRALLDEAPVPLLQGLANEVYRWMKPGKLEKNLRQLAGKLGASRDPDEWLKIG